MFRNIQNETLSLLKGSTFKNTPKVRANLSTYLQMKVYKALNPNVKFAGLITELKDTTSEDLITTKFKNLLKYPEFKQNKFIKYLKPLSPGEKGNTTPLHILKFDSTTTPTKELSEVFIDSINQMYHSSNPEIAAFATDLLNYQAAMNNMEFGNNSFMRFIPVQMLRDLAQNLQKLNTELAKSNPSESVIKELTGKTSAELQNEFIRNYISNSNNYRSNVNKDSLPKEYKPVHEYRFSIELYSNEYLKPWINTPEGNKALSDYLSTKYKDIQGDPEPKTNEEEIPEDRFEISPEDQETIVLSPEIIQGIEGSEVIKEDNSLIQKPFPGVENIPDSGLSIDQSNSFIDLLQPQILNQAYVENKAYTANRMFSFGLRWAKNIPNETEKSKQREAGLKPRPERVKINSVSTFDGYGYYKTDQNNNKLPSVKELQPIIDFIQGKLGIDMSNYDSVLANIYENNSYISQHRDITESTTAKNYPVIVINIGADGGLIYHTDYSDEAKVNPNQNTYNQFDLNKNAHKKLPIKNGGIYAFGVNGVNRFTFNHRVEAETQNTLTKPLIVPEWDSNGNKIGEKTLNNYRITLTFRRAQDLTSSEPKTPKRSKVLESQEKVVSLPEENDNIPDCVVII